MPLTVVVGGQYGSEGKGKMVAYLTQNSSEPVAVVRCGGSNAGHTVHLSGETYRLRQIPSGVVRPDCMLYLAPGMVIDLEVLFDEIEECRVSPSRLRIDRNAVIITEEDKQREASLHLRDRIGSTLSGTGSAAARKILREEGVRLAKDEPALKGLIADVSAELNSRIDDGAHVIVEGTQGFGLSVHHGEDYPFATGRDTTAAAFLSDCGLSPLLVTGIILVLRTYPIRVGGNSGPLSQEITWEEVARRGGHVGKLAEYTTVTGTLRRVGEFDWWLAERAVQANRPTAIALHGLDYVDYRDRDEQDAAELSTTSRRFVTQVKDRLGVPVRYVFTGPGLESLIEMGACPSQQPADAVHGASA